MAIVSLATFLATPMYAPVARIEIDPPGTELFTLQDQGPRPNDSEFVETQVRNLQSEELAISVIRQLHLDQNPAFVQRGILATTFRSIFPRRSSSDPTPRASGNSLALSSAEESALALLDERLTVKRDAGSRHIVVSVSTPDAELSAKLTNALVTTFIERSYETRHAVIMRSTEWLSRQLDDIRSQAEQSDKALADFQRRSGITDLEQNRSTVTQELEELNRLRTQADGERIQLESYLGRARAEGIESLPQVQSSTVVQQLSQRLAEKRAELAQSMSLYGKNHPTIRKLQNETEELEAQIQLQRTLIVAQLELSHTAAQSRVRLLENEIKGASKKIDQVSEYAALKKRAQANSELYNSLYSKVKEAGISAASTSSNIRVVDEARVLERPTSPRRMLNLAFGLIAALLSGILVTFILAAFDNRIHDVEDVRQCTGIGAVSVLPLAQSESATRRMFSKAPRSELPAPVRNFLASQNAASVEAEAVRSLETAVMLSKPEQPPQVLLVLSSLPGEGKTTVALNLGMTLAREGDTCLVDADFRRPALGSFFHLSRAAGLCEYMAGGIPLDKALYPGNGTTGLTVLPAGLRSSSQETTFSASALENFIGDLRDRFKFVVIDCPPILPYADGRAFSRVVDGVVFVGRADELPRSALTRALELLYESHSAPVVQVVLNGAHLGTGRYGYNYYQY